MKSGAADSVTGAGGTGPLCCGNVLQLWSVCLGHVLLCYCSHLGVWHLELWGSQWWRNFPLAKLSPVKLSPGENFPSPVLYWGGGGSEGGWVGLSGCRDFWVGGWVGGWVAELVDVQRCSWAEAQGDTWGCCRFVQTCLTSQLCQGSSPRINRWRVVCS